MQQGARVLRGQALTSSENYLVPPIHASSSGTITAIDSTHITIATDSLDESIKRNAAPKRPGAEQLVQLAHEAGLIGQGGAGFPLAAKLCALQDACLLLVNAAECDPLIRCDDALIRHNAASIVDSIIIIAQYRDIDRICIGIEDNKREAIDALQAALAERKETTQQVNIAVVPANYPSGAERTLLQLCSDTAPTAATNLAEAGVLSMNIASCHAFGEALKTGLPCTERVTTVVTTDGNSHNLLLRLGTTVDFIYHYLSQTDPLSTIERITTGGQMMYREISVSDSIVPTSNCIRFERHAPHTRVIQPCIRCGVCATACPENLMPQHLHTYAVSFNYRQLVEHRLDQCIECRCCDVVCPSQIPLAQQFHTAKEAIAANIQSEAAADIARVRYEKRQQRMAAKDRKKRRQVKRPLTTNAKTTSSHQALIEAALARKQHKSQGDR